MIWPLHGTITRPDGACATCCAPRRRNGSAASATAQDRRSGCTTLLAHAPFELRQAALGVEAPARDGDATAEVVESQARGDQRLLHARQSGAALLGRGRAVHQIAESLTERVEHARAGAHESGKVAAAMRGVRERRWR